MSEFEQKVLKLLEGIDSKLNKLLSPGTTSSAPVQATPSPSPASSPAPVPSPAPVKPSAVVDKQEMDEKFAEKPPVEGRRVCSKCSGTSFNTVEDKSQVLHQMGGVKIYAKKYICRGCGTEA